MADGWWIDTRDKPGLLRSMMRALSGNAYLSLEGDLAPLHFPAVIPADEHVTSLRRQTSSPLLDWRVLPLSKESEPLIWSELCQVDRLIERLIHVQIEKEGQLAFGAYDNFHKDCVFASEAVPLRLLESLRDTGVIPSFNPAHA